MKNAISAIIMTTAASISLAGVNSGNEVYSQVKNYSEATLQSPAVSDLSHLSQDIKHFRIISALGELNTIVQNAQTGFIPYKASYNKVKYGLEHINNKIKGLTEALKTQNFSEVPILTNVIEADFNIIWEERSSMWQSRNYVNDMSNYFIVEGIARINKKHDQESAIKSWAMLNQLAYDYPQHLFSTINKIISSTEVFVNITDNQLNSVINELQSNLKFQQLAQVSEKSQQIAKQVTEINGQVQNAKLFNKHVFNEKMREVIAQVDKTVQSASDRVQVINFIVKSDVTNYQHIVEAANTGNDMANIIIVATETLAEKTGKNTEKSYHEILYILVNLTLSVINK